MMAVTIGSSDGISYTVAYSFARGKTKNILGNTDNIRETGGKLNITTNYTKRKGSREM